MKTPIQFALILTGVGILAAGSVYGQHKAGQYESGDAGKIVRKLPQTAATDASYDCLLRQLPQPHLHHDAAAIGCRHLDSRSDQNAKDIRR